MQLGKEERTLQAEPVAWPQPQIVEQPVGEPSREAVTVPAGAPAEEEA